MALFSRANGLRPISAPSMEDTVNTMSKIRRILACEGSRVCRTFWLADLRSDRITLKAASLTFWKKKVSTTKSSLDKAGKTGSCAKIEAARSVLRKSKYFTKLSATEATFKINSWSKLESMN